MQTHTSLWARVTMPNQRLIHSYQLYANSRVDGGNLVSTGIGHVNYKPPQRVLELPRCLADRLTLIIMKGGSVEDVGTVMPEASALDTLASLAARTTGRVVWLYDLTFTHEDLLDLHRSEKWPLIQTKSEREVYQKLLDRLHPLDVYTKDSD